MTNPYHFEDLDEPIIQEVRQELLVDSILVFVHRLTYFFMSAAAYISVFIFDSFIVGRTLAICSGVLYITDALFTLVLIHLSTKRSRANAQIIKLHNEVTSNR